MEQNEPIKQFDIVSDYSDHFFAASNSVYRRNSTGELAMKVSGDWTKKIQKEWKILNENLPDSIFVRVYEERVDLMRAVIIGAAGTPYHNGLFFFDIIFGSNYPQSPPELHYHSRGIALNPNLYQSGYVCLSILNTWGNQWDSNHSTVLQVLVSLQGLVLNANPYFNEPAFEKWQGTRTGQRFSAAYTRCVYLFSYKTMLYTLQKPPMHFEDFVVDHFNRRGKNILEACERYMEDGPVRFCCFWNSKSDMDHLFKTLVKAFAKVGNTNCKSNGKLVNKIGSLEDIATNDKLVTKEAKADENSTATGSKKVVERRGFNIFSLFGLKKKASGKQQEIRVTG